MHDMVMRTRERIRRFLVFLVALSDTPVSAFQRIRITVQRRIINVISPPDEKIINETPREWSRHYLYVRTDPNCNWFSTRKRPMRHVAKATQRGSHASSASLCSCHATSDRNLFVEPSHTACTKAKFAFLTRAWRSVHGREGLAIAADCMLT